MRSGRPVSFWMQFSKIDEVDEAAQAKNMTRSEYVKAAVDRFLKYDAMVAKHAQKRAITREKTQN
jgi:metal-responsive CopG/Arc/MetJ family transcriptional regulator